MFNRQAKIPIDVNLRKLATPEELVQAYLALPEADHIDIEQTRSSILEEAKTNILKAQKRQKWWSVLPAVCGITQNVLMYQSQH